MKRALLITAAVALLVPAGAGAATHTRVTFGGYTPKGTGGFYGTVESPKKRCKDGRRVVVFHKDPGPDTRVGSDRAEASKPPTYSWFVADIKPVGGPYYAKAKPIEGCEGDRSRIYDLD